MSSEPPKTPFAPTFAATAATAGKPTSEADIAPTIEAVIAPASTARIASARRFEPGSIIAGRYRLVAMLGRGGMGEVYRADDLTLDQPVALKFLPAGVAADEARLAQFHNELRVARQVSHRHVCRLYDLGESDGHRFLTMEYVDGEDLASLLKRIGRVPQERAVQMARQLCAGIAAAHERGLLHRDLKPANVMIDGEGDVRITDFGIATAVGEVGASLAGTPQYMAPELISGQAASVRSDIYALGLILFELFTGRRAVDSKTLGDLRQFYQTGTITTPSSIVSDLDPATERVILRCLDKDPNRRPTSALAVAAALPGGDPLAAALAAGETPSPEMLAAAGETEALSVGRGLALLTVVIAGIVLIAAAAERVSFVGRTPLPTPPDVLADRAQRIISAAGYTDAAADTADGFRNHDDYTRWLRSRPGDPKRWDVLATGNPSAVLFWYRTSPRDLLPLQEDAVQLDDPPEVEPGMRTVVLDPRGRLVSFRAVPPRTEADGQRGDELDWTPLFEAAELTMSSFTPVAPTHVPAHFADTRAAWQGPLPGRPEITLRVEAAGYRGRAVAFEVGGPWTERALQRARFVSTADRVLIAIIVGGLLAMVLTAVVLARRHVRSNRADRRGAARLTTFLAAAVIIAWVVRADHVASADEIQLFLQSQGPTAVILAIFWAVYVAAEPYVRRFWPDALLGWSRLLAGHIRDPRIGRDVLIGMAFGVAIMATILARILIPPALGYSAGYPGIGVAIDAIEGPSAVVWGWLIKCVDAIGGALFAVLVVVLLRLLIRWNWLAIGLTVVLLSFPFVQEISRLWYVVFPLAGGALLTLIAMRFGLLTLAVAYFTSSLLEVLPLSLDVGHWSAAASAWSLAGLAVLACWAFYASRAGQPLFGRLMDDRT